MCCYLHWPGSLSYGCYQGLQGRPCPGTALGGAGVDAGEPLRLVGLGSGSLVWTLGLGDPVSLVLGFPLLAHRSLRCQGRDVSAHCCCPVPWYILAQSQASCILQTMFLVAISCGSHLLRSR